MLNAEKYKERIKELNYNIALCDGELQPCGDEKCMKCSFYKTYGRACNPHILEWLLEEYKSPPLDEAEREYLSAVIKPFRKRIKSIKKTDYPSNSAFISIAMDKYEHIFLPVFELNSGMYQRMEINKEYTLEELGL